jgi:hypothetical protein
VLWPVWLAAAVAVTAPVMAWHVARFRGPGDGFYIAVLAGLPLLGAAGVVWSRVRRRGLWRYEPLLAASMAVLLAAWKAPVALAVTALLFASAYAGGRRLRERWGLAVDSPVAELGLSSALGFGVLHLVLFGLGMAGLLYWWVVLPLLAAPLAAGWRTIPDALGRLRAAWLESGIGASPAAGLLVPFAAVLALCTAAVALAPAIAFDAVTMHLPLARYYAQEHALRVLPGLDYSFFPQSAEVVFAAAWMLGGQTAAQLVTPGFFVLALLLLWAVLRECGATPPGSAWGVLFAASMPFLHWSGSVVKNDLQLALFQLAALYGILRWRPRGDFRWILAAAAFAGCSFGVKHPALFAGLPLGILLLGAAWREPRRIRAIAAVLILAAAFGLFWHVRTLALAGSPVYPLRAGESATPDRVDQDLAARIERVAKLPFTAPFAGAYHFESPSPTPLGLALVVFWPVWLVSGRIARAERICLFVVVVSFFWWGWLSPMVRYIAAPLAVLAGLAGTRAASLFDRWPGPVRWTTGFAALWCVAQALCSLMLVEINAPQLRRLAGTIGREEYLAVAATPYRSLEFLVRQTGPDDRILGVGNCMAAYAPPAPRFRSVCIDSAWTAAGIAGQLRAGRYTWLVAPAAMRAETVEALRMVGQPGEARYEDSSFVVYRLR